MSKINVAVIGVNGFGRAHLRAFDANKNANLVAVCDINEEYAKELGEKYNVAYTTSFDEILENSEIDAVSIALPDQLHAQYVTRALRAGKDVLCEKPLALNLEHCREMIRVAKETGRYLMVGQICRFTPGFVMAKKIIDEGIIGELFFVESEYAHDYSKMTCEWRKNDPERDGFLGGACHAVDLLRWIAGNPKLTLFREDAYLKDGCHETPIEIPVEVSNHNIIDEINEFVSCIIEKRTPILSPEEGAATVSICLSAIKSAKEHRSVEVEYDF